MESAHHFQALKGEEINFMLVPVLTTIWQDLKKKFTKTVQNQEIAFGV